MMLTIGCHLSSSKGFLQMGKDALSIGANTFQFFTRNPRGGAAKALDVGDAQALTALAQAHGFGKLVAHAPYTLNPCAANEATRAFTRATMADDIARMEALPGNYYNFHPGSHVQQGAEVGIALIADMLNAILAPGQTTLVLLETMAGKGSEIGGTFEELRAIIDRVELSDHVGVCLDTCHVYDAGYDIVQGLDGVLAAFDRVIGLPRLKAIHLNDSKYPFHSRHDRHEKIGQGHLGLEALVRVITHPQLAHLPFILETPQDDSGLAGYREEIALLRGRAQA